MVHEQIVELEVRAEMTFDSLRSRIRVGGVIFRGDEVLIVEHCLGNGRWRCFPGGRLEPGEALEACLRRELIEEVGLNCDVGELVAVGDVLDSTNHAVELYFKSVAGQGTPRPRCETISGVWFVDYRELPEWNVFPLELSADVAKCGAQGLNHVRNYGRFK